uniref:Deltameth_res domain-containing protein n=1 Tax=Angiostrongylus cantonensis TaxID=6313 RepID=A0A0K0DLP4_ANGCA
LDYMPVPFQPYRKVYDELQAKFNTYLAVSIGFLVLSFGLAFYNDIFIIEALSKPKSYRNRHKN